MKDYDFMFKEYGTPADNTPPTHGTPVIDPTYPTQDTNITCSNTSTTDIDGNTTIYNTYNWLQNGSPTMVAYFSFDYKNSSTSAEVRDYSGNDNFANLSGSNAPTWSSSGRVGGAYDFAGDGDDETIVLTNGSTFIT